MRPLIIALLLALVIMIVDSTKSKAESVEVITGNGLLKVCESTEERDFDICYGYIGGILSLIRMLEIEREIKPFFCVPNNVLNSQTKEIIINFLRENPSLRHHLSAYSVIKALSLAFPCQNKGTTN